MAKRKTTTSATDELFLRSWDQPAPAPARGLCAMTHDTDWTDYPTCPECGHVDEEWWEPGRLENDGDTTPVECPACGADYLAEAHMQRHFSTEPLADALRRRIAQHERQLAGPVFGIPSLGAGVPGLRDAVRDSLVSGLEKARADLAKVEERERVRKGIK